MTKDHLKYLTENQARLVLMMLRHCMNLAAIRYRWTPIRPLPGGKDPEGIVEEVLAAFLNGDRNFADDFPIDLQLKRGVESRLWALHQRTDSRVVSIDELALTKGEFLESDTIPPNSEAEIVHDEKVLFSLLRGNDEIRTTPELQLMVNAIQDGADDATSQAAHTGMPVTRVYELRRRLKSIVPSVLTKFNKGNELLV